MAIQESNQNKTNFIYVKKILEKSKSGDFSALKENISMSLKAVRESCDALREIEKEFKFKAKGEAERKVETATSTSGLIKNVKTDERKAPAPRNNDRVNNSNNRTNDKPTSNKSTYVNPNVTPAIAKPAQPSYVKGSIVLTPPTERPKKTAVRQYIPNNRGANGTNNYNNNNRPQTRPTTPRPNTGAPRPSYGNNSAPAPTLASTLQNKSRKVAPSKKPTRTSYDEKQSMNKRTLIRKGFVQESFDEDRIRIRKLRNKKKDDVILVAPKKIDSINITSAQVSIKTLSELMGVSALDLMAKLLAMGGSEIKSINDYVDYDTLFFVAEEFNVKLNLKLEKTEEEKAEALHDEQDADDNLIARPPVVTVMGHVDHGKTSLLDAIRQTDVVRGEAGGITQHIGAYTVNWNYEKNDRSITFLDTPGHEAFTEMRARGTKVTDIVVLVVAADDGVQPQTIEAISHVKNANAPLIVAINKIDKPDANIDKIKQELSTHNVITTEWGGDVTMVPISAIKKTGIDNLLQEILFLADYVGCKANPDRKAKGVVVEARLDKGKGPVATVIVQNGTLKKGDAIVTGKTYGKIRAMTDSYGKPINSAPPSTPVVILGLNDVPNAGDNILVVDDEKTARQIVGERGDKTKTEMLANMAIGSLDDALKLQQSEQKTLSVVIKADVQGSAEALKNVLSTKENEEVKVKVVHSGVGIINKSDIMLASVSNALILGFNVKADNDAKNIAEKSEIKIISSKIIYDLIDVVDNAMNGMVEPKYRDVTIGHAEVRDIFKISSIGVIAGSYVLDGKIQRNAKAIVTRGSEVIYEGKIAGLKHFKDDAKEMKAGFECGILIEGFTDFKQGDQIEAIIAERIN